MLAFLLVRTVPGQDSIDAVRQRLECLPEVLELADTKGGWDLLVKIEIEKPEQAGAFVKNHIIGKDVIETRTLYALNGGKK